MLLAWSLSWTTGAAIGAGPAIYPSRAACDSAGREQAAESKVQEAKDEATAIRAHGYFETTVGYDLRWRCTEVKVAMPPVKR